MTLPRAEEAVVDPRKLRDYCLNPNHPGGKHKARVFRSALGLTRGDGPELREAILQAAQQQEAQPTRTDSYGIRYVLDFEMSTSHGHATVRSTWIVRSDEAFPRLTSCYVL